MENLPQNETKVSNELPEIDFNSLSLEEKVGSLAQELELELANFTKFLPRLSKKQLERVLLLTLNYPMNMITPGSDQVEKVLSHAAKKIEHLKILTIKFADELDKQQKETTNGSEVI